MSRNQDEFQPGAILHEVIVGAFRARGMTFDHWCRDNGLTPSNGRNATFGQSRGELGRANLERIIDAAGRDAVRDLYTWRIAEHARQLAQGAAPAAGDEGGIDLRIASAARALTRTLSLKRGDASQQLRSGDRFRRYAEISGTATVAWGEK